MHADGRAGRRQAGETDAKQRPAGGLTKVPFKFVIRHNIENATDDFGSGDVRHFEALPVTVGAGRQCDCRVDTPAELNDIEFSVSSGQAPDTFRILPEGNRPVYLNAAAVTGETELHSGDEIRVGHFTFRFQRERASAGQGRRAGVLGRLAQALIVLILLAEISVVYWLPREFQSQQLLALQISKQDTILLVDQLRQKAREAVQPGETASLSSSAALLAGEELDRMSQFIRTHENQLTDLQWRRLRRDLALMRHVLAAADTRTVSAAAPEPPVGSALEAVLSAAPQQH